MCHKLDVGCQVKEGIGSVVQNQFESLAREIGESAAEGLHAVSTFWITIDAPSTTTGDPLVPIRFLQSGTWFIVLALAVVSVILGGIRMAWESHGEPVRDLLRSLLTLALVTGMGSMTIQLLTSASDAFALWLVNASLPAGATFESQLGKLVMVGSGQALLPVGAGKLPLFALMFFAVLCFVSSLLQVVLMLIRSGMLMLLAGTLPLAAAMTNTELGRSWFKKYCGWIIAFVAYKPAAALVYAAAYTMLEEGAQDLVGVATGLMMLLLAVLALPALLRLVVPATAAVAGGSPAIGIGAGALGGLATGARSIGRSGSSGGTSGGGSGGPPGSGGGGFATGAAGVAASALGAAASVAGSMQKTGGKLAEAASHSAGEPVRRVLRRVARSRTRPAAAERPGACQGECFVRRPERQRSRVTVSRSGYPGRSPAAPRSRPAGTRRPGRPGTMPRCRA